MNKLDYYYTDVDSFVKSLPANKPLENLTAIQKWVEKGWQICFNSTFNLFSSLPTQIRNGIRPKALELRNLVNQNHPRSAEKANTIYDRIIKLTTSPVDPLIKRQMECASDARAIGWKGDAENAILFVSAFSDFILKNENLKQYAVFNWFGGLNIIKTYHNIRPVIIRQYIVKQHPSRDDLMMRGSLMYIEMHCIFTYADFNQKPKSPVTKNEWEKINCSAEKEQAVILEFKKLAFCSMWRSAVKSRRLEVIDLLSKYYDYFTDDDNKDEPDPLLLAIMNGDDLIASRLIDFVNKRDRVTTLLHVMVMHDQVDLAKKLILLGMNIEANNENNRTPLQIACRKSVAMTKLLIDAGADVNTSRPPLYLADDLEIVQILLQAGANVNSLYLNSSLLYHTIQEKKIDKVKMLLDWGLNPNGLDSSKECGLTFAMMNEQDDVVNELIRRGADVDYAEPVSGRTPLMATAQNPKFINSLRKLLEAGADVRLTNKYSQTALDIARNHHNIKAVQLLSYAETNHKLA